MTKTFYPRQLLPSLTEGLALGVFAVIASVSFAALIFSEELSSYLPIGIALALWSAAIVGVIVSVMSAYPGTIAGPQHTTAAILALLVSAIATSLATTASETEVLITVVAAIVFNSLITGIFFFCVGWFRLGELIRFIPYPVIGGFLAGTGWLLAEGSLQTMTESHLSLAHLSHFFEPEILLQWLPGAIFGVLLFLALHHYHSLLIVLGMMVGATALFYLVLAATGTSITQAGEQGLLLGPFTTAKTLHPFTLSTVSQANWSAIFRQIPTFATIWLIDIIGLLLSVSSIEIAVHRDINFNHELKAAGIASFVSGWGGGLSGFHIPSDTALVYKLGGAKRLVGLISAALCVLVLLLGTSKLAFCPKLIVGGVLLFLGLDLLMDWVYLTWFKLPWTDYGIIILILLVAATVGFLPGVIVGVIAAVILFAINYSQINVTKHTFSGVNRQSHLQRLPAQESLLREQGEQIYILELQGVIFFGTAHKLLKQIRQRLDDSSLPPVRFLLLDFRLVNGLDTSAVLSFVKLQQMARQRQFHLLFTHLSAKDTELLQQGGCLETQNNLSQVFADLDRGLEWCENQILTANPAAQQRLLPLVQQLQTLIPDSAEIDKLMNYVQPVSLRAGDFLFRQGDPSDGLYFLESGQVSVTLDLSHGKTKRLRTYNSGTILGEIGLYANAPRSASIVADEPSYLYYLATEAFRKIEREEPQLANSFHKFIVNLLAERLKRREGELRNLLQ